MSQICRGVEKHSLIFVPELALKMSAHPWIYWPLIWSINMIVFKSWSHLYYLIILRTKASASPQRCELLIATTPECWKFLFQEKGFNLQWKYRCFRWSENDHFNIWATNLLSWFLLSSDTIDQDVTHREQIRWARNWINLSMWLTSSIHFWETVN